MDDDRKKLLKDLLDLDDELEDMELDEDESQTNDDELLIVKLQEEAAYLEGVIRQCDEQSVKNTQEIKNTNSQNQVVEMENVASDKKLVGADKLESKLKELQGALSNTLDQEKQLFDENLKLLQ